MTNTTNKKSPSSCCSAGSNTTQKGSAMQNEEYNTTLDEAGLKWAEALQALHAELKPLESKDDPRWAELQAIYPFIDNPISDSEWLAERHFSAVTVAGLSLPIPAPAWGVTRRIGVSEWPLIEIEDHGQWWDSQGIRARLITYTQVVVEDLPADWNSDPDGDPLPGEPDTRPAGSVSHWPVKVEVEVEGGDGPFDLTIEQAQALEGVLGDACHQFHVGEVIPA